MSGMVSFEGFGSVREKERATVVVCVRWSACRLVGLGTRLVLGHADAGEVVAPDGGVDHEGHAEDRVHAAGVRHHGVRAAQEA